MNPRAVVTEEELDELFDRASSSVVRVEALPAYDASDDESTALALYRHEVATKVAQAVMWERLRVIDTPPTSYQRWELEAYQGNQAAGETIHLVPRHSAGSSPDYWLFDDRAAVLMHYDASGRLGSLELVETSTKLDELTRYAAHLRTQAVSLDEYLAAGGAARAS